MEKYILNLTDSIRLLLITRKVKQENNVSCIK